MSITEDRRRGGRLRFDVASSVLESPDGAPLVDSDPRRSPHALSDREHRDHRRVWVLYAVLGALLVAYIISVFARTAAQSWTWLDGWSVASLELVAVALCVYKGRVKRPGRSVPLVLGLGLLCWTLGDFVLTYESLGGKTPA